MRRVLLSLAVVLLAACGSRPPAPDWQVEAHAGLERYQKAWLAGQVRAAQAEFARARQALTATGQAALVARAELTRCALQVAGLDFQPCSGFEPLRADAGEQEQAYAAYLQGDALSAAQAQRLPPQHRAVAAGGASTQALRALDDPLARLVAAGVTVRAGRATPETLALAVDTASREGWRRPLLAWLEAQARTAERAGDTVAAAQARQRIALVTGEGMR